MAPIPKKELMARLRKERKKDEAKWNEELMKDRQRKKESYTRQKGTLSAAELQERREKTRIKVQQCRLRKSSIGQSSKPSSNKSKYKTPQSLGKAVKKVCAALPKSSGKQSIVFKEIIKKTFSQDVCKKLFHNSREVKK